MAKFQLYKDTKKEYRWRLKADNGKIIADSGEGYDSKSNCQNGIQLVKELSPKASIEDLTEK